MTKKTAIVRPIVSFDDLALRLLDAFGGTISDEIEETLIDKVKQMDESLSDRQASLVVQTAMQFEQFP